MQFYGIIMQKDMNTILNSIIFNLVKFTEMIVWILFFFYQEYFTRKIKVTGKIIKTRLQPLSYYIFATVYSGKIFTVPTENTIMIYFIDYSYEITT